MRSTAGQGGALSYSTALLSGPALTVTQIASDFHFTQTAAGGANSVYRFTVTEAGGTTATADITIPALTATADATGHTRIRMKIGGVLETTPTPDGYGGGTYGDGG
jgi:hypothetical protein